MNTNALLATNLQAMAALLLDLFPDKMIGVVAPEGNALLFRGPVVHQPGGNPGTGTHVVVEFDPALIEALLSFDEEKRASSLADIEVSLRTQISAKYAPAAVGQFALKITATKGLLES